MNSEGDIVMAKSLPEKRQAARQMQRQMTPAENLLWQRLRANRLAGLHFRRQQVLAGFVVDFYCHAVRLVVEVDGDVHKQQPDYDAERSRILRGLNVRVLRFSNREVCGSLETVLRRIVSAARQAFHNPDAG